MFTSTRATRILPAVALTLATNAYGAAAEEGRVAGPREDVSGVLVGEQGESEASAARSLLVVPRVAVTAVATPVSAGLRAYERYQLKERVLDIFFDDTRTFGVYPTLSLESNALPGVGLRLVHKDLFGTGARLRAAADYGGEHQQRVDGSLSTPALFGAAAARLHLRGGWQKQPRAPFYGIGDHALPEAGTATTFRQTITRAEVQLTVDPAGPLFGGLSSSFVSRRFEQQPGTAGVGAADLAALAGWRGTDVSYSEAQLGIDTLRVAGPWVPTGAPSSGTRVSAFGGLATGIGDDPTRYVRYGFDALQYFDLYAGDRVLVLRLHSEAVSALGDAGEGGLERIPFTDLPRLGGPHLLRGYTRDRFRDRLAVVGSVEYRYPIWRQLAGFLFVDAGRVTPDLAALVRAPGDLRLGWGGGVELYQGERFRMRTQLAGSRDGFFFHLALEAVYRQSNPPYRI